jgi:hypothetical protein
VKGEGVIATAMERLQDARPAVRRIAVMDVLRDGGEAGLAVLVERVREERDERTALLMVRAFAARKYQPARIVLAGLRDDVTRPAAVAHAALLAHDALEVAARPAAVAPVVDPEDAEADEEG